MLAAKRRWEGGEAAGERHRLAGAGDSAGTAWQSCLRARERQLQSTFENEICRRASFQPGRTVAVLIVVGFVL